MKMSLRKVVCAMLAVASLNACATHSALGETYYIDVEKTASVFADYNANEETNYATLTTSGANEIASYAAFTNSGVCGEASLGASEDIKVGSRFWELFFGKSEPKKLIASGDVFGIKLKQKYPTIVDAPGVPALKSGDAIISINKQEVHSAAELKDIIKRSGGESLTIAALRGDEKLHIEVVPKLEGDEYRIGITLKDVTAGIGTITFIDPNTGEFGGLGHGICSAENGSLIDMTEGTAMDVALGGVHKGEAGSPGELSGVMADSACGKIYLNTDVGVFGKLNGIDDKLRGSIFEVGSKNDIVTGEATIISTVKNGKKAEYKIEIFDIDRDSTGSKSFKIKVKDPALLAISGGIVRGMSGSPIIQNGKLVGAVTHVLVNDPTVGYGIFIENMLKCAKNANNSGQKAA
ncbi:MAG: SpoIVB peptidase [Clostridia bacterium]|nr:SpoIVB peptidase [Clostridia bacterium]